MHQSVTTSLLSLLLAIYPIYAQVFVFNADGITTTRNDTLPVCASTCGNLYNVQGACTPKDTPININCFCTNTTLTPIDGSITTGVSKVCAGSNCTVDEGLPAIKKWYQGLCAAIQASTFQTSSSTTGASTIHTSTTASTSSATGSSSSSSSTTPSAPSSSTAKHAVTLTSVSTKTLSSDGILLSTFLTSYAGASSDVLATQTISLMKENFSTISCYFLSTQALAARATGSQTSQLQLCQVAQHGLSTGAEAGIGVGSAIGGLIVILAGVWFCIRRKRMTKRGEHEYGNRGTTHSKSDRQRKNMNEKLDVAASAIPLPNAPVERADDSEVRNMMQDLNEFIDQHVENHYHMRDVPASQEENIKKGLTKVGYTMESPLSIRKLKSLLTSPQSRKPAIRFLIASVMFEHIGSLGFKNPEASLLPTKILDSYQAFSKKRGLPATREATTEQLQEWRNRNLKLLTSSTAGQADRQLNSSIAQHVSRLNLVLQTFVEKGEGQRKQQENLSSIFMEGASFGIFLLLQPGRWVFGWDESRQTRDDRMLVFPSLGEEMERHGKHTVRIVAGSIDEEV